MVLQRDGLPAELILPVRHAAAAQGVGNQTDPPGKQPESHAHGTGVHMDPVTDQLRGDRLPLRGGADDAGLPVMDRRHGVVKVGQMACPRRIDSRRLLIRRIRMGHGYGTETACLLRKCHGSGQFRRHIHDADQPAAALVELLKSLEIRGPQIGSVLGSFFLLREERSLHMYARDAGTSFRTRAVQGLRGLEGSAQCLVRKCHGSRHEGGDPVGGQIRGHAPQSLRIPVREVRAGSAVRVNIHQPGKHLRAAQIHIPFRRSGKDLREDPVLHPETTGDIAFRRKYLRMIIQHDDPSRARRGRFSARV